LGGGALTALIGVAARFAASEYWLVYPRAGGLPVRVKRRAGKISVNKMNCGDDIATPFLFPDLEIDLKEVFLE